MESFSKKGNMVSWFEKFLMVYNFKNPENSLVLLMDVSFFSHLHINRSIGLMSRVFANGPGDRGSIPDRVIPKIQKMVADSALLSTQPYKVRVRVIKGKVKQSREWSSALPYTLV